MLERGVSSDGGTLTRQLTRGTAAVLRSIFDHFDADSNGRIDEEEMTTMIKMIYELQLSCTSGQVDPAVRMSAETKWRVEARLIFERADAEGDGGIDYEEFVHAAQGMPVLALGLALFRQVHGAARQAGAMREVRVASSELQQKCQLFRIFLLKMQKEWRIAPEKR